MGCKCSKQQTRKLEKASSRRNHLASHPLIIERREKIPDTIEVIREYVDTGKGHLISTSCFRSKSMNKKQLNGMIFYCQGYGSCTEWTDTDIGINFVNRGYIFITHDHYGHGCSDGDWLTSPTLSHDTYVDDASYIFERAKRKFTPELYIENNKKFHYFLLGHSLGGAIAIEISKRYTSSSYYGNVEKRLQQNKDGNVAKTNDYIPKTLLESYCNNDVNINTNNMEQDSLFGWDGMILLAPMVKIRDGMKPPAFLIKIGSYLAPLLPDARIVPVSNFAVKLTRDEAYFDMIKKSPLSYEDRPALRTAMLLLGFTQHIEQEIDFVQLPLLIMHGEKDQLTDPGMSQLFYDKCSSKDKKIKIFGDAFHTLLLDTCRNEVFEEIDNWILERS